MYRLPKITSHLTLKMFCKVFLTLLAKKVGKIIKAKNSSKGQRMPRINMMTKEPLRKQIIIPMTKLNAELIINSANQFITNINITK